MFRNEIILSRVVFESVVITHARGNNLDYVIDINTLSDL